MHHIEIVSQLEGAHLTQLPGLLAAARRADGHEPLGEHKFLRLQRGDDLAVAMLAFEDGRLRGYAHTVTYRDCDKRRASCEVVVHPAYRRRGVGRLLLAHAIMHAHSQSAHRLDLWAYNYSEASAHIAAQFGFAPARRLLHLHRRLAGVPRASRADGVRLRTFRPGLDDAAWLALNNRMFAGHPENGAWSAEDLRARMSQPWFDPRDVLLAEVEGALAGSCWLKVEGGDGERRSGEIYVIGTAPAWRGRGIGRHLLDRGLRHLALKGVDTAAIYVDEANAPAVALYESAGFHHHHVDVCYSRALSGAEAAGGRLAA